MAVRVYHFVPRAFGIEDIKLRRLKVAQIEDLNDPFELRGFQLTDPRLRTAFEKNRKEMALRKGLLCFSRSWRNPVQWSHYAEKHRGLALGFDVPEELLAAVKYSSKRARADFDILLAAGPDALAMMMEGLTTKFAHWRYEQESRISVDLNDKDPKTSLYFAEFSDQLRLREVIVGADSDITRAELSDALSELASTVKAMKARLAFGSFRVVEQKMASLWV